MPDPTVSGLLISATTALAGCVVYLWKQITTNHKTVMERYRECEAQRESLISENVRLSAEIRYLRPVLNFNRPINKKEQNDV